jgi:hypothetical protein
MNYPKLPREAAFRQHPRSLDYAGEEAWVQECRIRAKISLNAWRRLRHVQRPTPSHFSANTPGFSSPGHGRMARRHRVSIVVNEILRAYHSTM